MWHGLFVGKKKLNSVAAADVHKLEYNNLFYGSSEEYALQIGTSTEALSYIPVINFLMVVLVPECFPN